MNWSSFKYLARQGLHSMVKNRLMSVASIGVLTVCLLITGVAGLFTLNVGSLMDYLGSQNETVVYLDEDLTEEGLAAVDSALRSISGLREVTYVSKDEALERMKESMGDNAYLFDVFEGSENPFLANYRVVLDDVSDLPEIQPQLEAIEGVSSVGAPMQLSQMFTSVHKGVSLVCVILVAVLGFVSVVVISNTIRLTVFARRKEINIMKFVGATNAFIRLPFFVEGMTVGAISGVLATVVVGGAYYGLEQALLQPEALWLNEFTKCMWPFMDIIWPLLGGFVLFGVAIGGVGCASSIRKHLKV